MVDIIKKKRDGGSLTRDEIFFFVNTYTRGQIPDYQASALLMAIFFRGMDDRETSTLAEAMMKSGEALDLSDIKGPKVDKHSTGGVGDKISLPLAPIVSSLGIYVPMISGRALGHTGGTLDKLESIKGLKTALSLEEFKKQLAEIGVVMAGQTENLCPADKKLYALRDVTATVESIPLISASIMSKKLAEDIDGLVLDVKTGKGAFMSDLQDAKKLAETMVTIGKSFGKNVKALITNMDQPLGRKIGNALEIEETVEILRGEGPEDVKELTFRLAAEMLIIGKKANSYKEAYEMISDTIKSGKALEKWHQLVEYQGGEVEHIYSHEFTKTKYTYELAAKKGGFLYSYDTYAIGIAVSVLGAGRSTKDDTIDHKVGIALHKKVGDFVSFGEPIMEIRYNEVERFEKALKILTNCYVLDEIPPQKPLLVMDTAQ
ncbi:MAG TPA: thymidine phosphorylase [Candidatus Hydrothermia bacterium]|nr:thymidine phosphorylase [Candidatus Hydrothermia bacterium]MDD5573345.1 thymidine phosphorylase [Candidatus Hydrothermia bacterium]HOK22879.1 thymidine phosphorylase [Candidatus Hydrothermia bacterium]HOL23588.1 thymidine phosphorylase [Candidatus Hydrothermia bacterium]HOP32320.1 thymidine phosphorylase [Candidatus Hydrothermia bacterium]